MWTHRRGLALDPLSSAARSGVFWWPCPSLHPCRGHVLAAWPGQGPGSEQDGSVGLAPGLALPDGQDTPSKRTPSIHAPSGRGCGLGSGVFPGQTQPWGLWGQGQAEVWGL